MLQSNTTALVGCFSRTANQIKIYQKKKNGLTQTRHPELDSGSRCLNNGFTVLEMMVVIFIVFILLLVAIPQYQKALDKSRFATLEPLTKKINESQERFYLDHGYYTDDLGELDLTLGEDVEGKSVERGEGIKVTLGDEDEFKYVVGELEKFDNRYVAYQRNSQNYAGDIHCEAVEGDSRANRLCRALGGEYLGINRDYEAYRLSGGGTGTFDRDCKSSQPTNTRVCGTGCMRQYRTVTCNARYGTWETTDFEGVCDERPSVEEPCDGDWTGGTMTRTIGCTSDDTAWTVGEWNRDACIKDCKEAERPIDRQPCSVNHGENSCGYETRSVTCNLRTGLWDVGNWQGACNSKPEVQTSDISRTCSSVNGADSCGTQSRTYSQTCNNDSAQWSTTYGEWTGTCNAKGSVSRPCSDQYGGDYCGMQTRTASCDDSNATWSYGEWTGTCNSKGSVSQGCSSGCGTQTRTASCNNDTATWSYGGWTGNCPSRPASSQGCGGGYTNSGNSMTRDVWCSGGSWQTGGWNTGSCGCAYSSQPGSTTGCGGGYTNSGNNMTRSVWCSGTSWQTGGWDAGACGCAYSSQPASSNSCDCGYQYRSVWCSGTSWQTGGWNVSCPKKPFTGSRYEYYWKGTTRCTKRMWYECRNGDAVYFESISGC